MKTKRKRRYQPPQVVVRVTGPARAAKAIKTLIQDNIDYSPRMDFAPLCGYQIKVIVRQRNGARV